MLTRVVVTGSESTGKTTLAAQLAAHYGVHCVPEYSRVFVAQLGRPIEARDHEALGRGQMANEDAGVARARADAHNLLIYDTDLTSTVTYCHHYTGSCPAFIEEAALARKASLYLLCDIDVPWVPDGVRDRSDRREEMHAAFVATLERFEARYVVLRGTWAEREMTARREIAQLRHGDMPPADDVAARM